MACNRKNAPLPVCAAYYSDLTYSSFFSCRCAGSRIGFSYWEIIANRPSTVHSSVMLQPNVRELRQTLFRQFQFRHCTIFVTDAETPCTAHTNIQHFFHHDDSPFTLFVHVETSPSLILKGLSLQESTEIIQLINHLPTLFNLSRLLEGCDPRFSNIFF